jgi:hypothetical protein
MVSCNNEERADMTRLVSDVRAAWIELLSARCATDRLRLRYSPQQIARLADRATLNKTMDAVGVMCNYFTEVRSHIEAKE